MLSLLNLSRSASKVGYFHIIKMVREVYNRDLFIYKIDSLKSQYISDEFQMAYNEGVQSLYFDITINTPMQWPFLTPKFASVYSGSSDREINKLSNNHLDILAILNEHIDFSFISVIGGGYILDLLNYFDNLDKIIFFDENINEFVKLCDLFYSLKVSPELEFQDIIESNSDYYNEYLVPKPKNGKIKICTDIENTLVENLDVGPEYFPIIEKKDNYPNRIANFTHAEKCTLALKLEKATVKNAFFDIPRIVFNNSLPVIYLSNISENIYSNERIERLISSQLGLVIIRSNISDVSIKLNSHLVWNLFIQKYLVGNSHHLWNKSELNKNNFDPNNEIGKSWSFLGDRKILLDTNTLILHFPFTRSQEQNIVTRSKLQRDIQSVSISLKRILWCEYVTKNMKISNRNLLWFEDILNKHGFKQIGEVYVPEDFSNYRSKFIIYER